MNDLNNNNNNNNTSNPLASILSNTGRHMGDLVTWSVSGKKERTTIDQLLIDLGFTTNPNTDNEHKIIDIPSVSPINAFKRAIRELLTTRGLKKIYTLEKVQADKEKIVYAIIAKELVSTTGLTDPTLNLDIHTDVAFETKMHLVFDSNNYYYGTKSVVDLVRVTHEDNPLCQRFVALYNEYCTTYTTDDIRTGFQRAFTQAGGMKFSAHGGLYWIPSTSAQLVRDWQSFMNATSNQAIIIPMFDSVETIATLKQQTTDSLEGQLETVFDDLEKFIGGDKTRKSTINARITEFDEITARAELYEGLLGHNLGKLKTNIELAKQGLIESLNNPATDTDKE